MPAQCGQQPAAPRHADYLMAPLFVLKQSMDRLQHTSLCAQLSRGLYWWNIDQAFQECKCRRSKPSGRCTSLVRKLHGKSLEGSSNQASMCLPEVFQRYPAAAIIMGYEPQHLTKDAPTADGSTPKPLSQSVSQRHSTSGSARQQDRSPSDSGYASHVGNGSRDSESSSFISEEASLEGFKIRGVARETDGRKLVKRRKMER